MNNLVLGGMLFLLLFGCVSQRGSPSQNSIGDAEISVPQDQGDEFIEDDDNLIPPPEDTTGLANESTDSEDAETSVQEVKITADDLFVDQGMDEDLIDEEDIIEPI